MTVFRYIGIGMMLILSLILSIEAKEPFLYGKASWYSYESCRREGTNGRITASGEKFDENSNIAAIWNVPFGTKIKVTNLRNKKFTYVIVEDRGPSKRLVKKGRIIDLSKKSFSEIEDLKKGLCLVKLEMIKVPSTTSKKGGLLCKKKF